MSDGFYRAFEDRHRGSREVIKSRQRVYLPFIQPLIQLYPNASAIDLGCGRGEWLELLQESGFQAQGVDLDDGMLAVCREHGLKVQTKDAIAGLKECSDDSQAVVSGFHLAEHIPFDVLETLIKESLRVLKPGGLLILETPNPENIVVGTANFYLDPTHKQPIPPLLLSFLAEYLGFENVKVIRLQGPVDLASGRKLTIHDILGGVSPDYAIVAQKLAPQDISQDLSWAFKSEYGVTLGALVGAYESQMDKRLNQRFNQIMSVAQEALSKAQFAESALNEIHQSLFWRLTKPVRWMEHQYRLIRKKGLTSRANDFLKKLLRPFVSVGIGFFNARPKLRAKFSGTGGKKGLYDHLRSLYLRVSFNAESDLNEQVEDSPYAPILLMTDPTPSAGRVCEALKSAIEQNKAKQ